MDQEINGPTDEPTGGEPAPLPRRQLLKYGLYSLACASAGGSALYYLKQRADADHHRRGVQARRPRRRPVAALAGQGLGPRSPPLSQAGAERAVPALPQRLRAGAGRPQPLPRPRQPRRHALHAGLRQSLRDARRSDREEAAVPLPARRRGLLDRHRRLRLPLPELPELGHFAEQARGDQGPARTAAAAAPDAAQRAGGRGHAADDA